MSVKTDTDPKTDIRSLDDRCLDERYYDARTLDGLAESQRGEGYTEEEFRDRFVRRIKGEKSSSAR